MPSFYRDPTAPEPNAQLPLWAIHLPIRDALLRQTGEVVVA